MNNSVPNIRSAVPYQFDSYTNINQNNNPTNNNNNPNSSNTINNLPHEFETHKRGSVFSLHSLQANSLYHYRTMTLQQPSQGEGSEQIRVSSEVTLGADKRRKLLTSEDADLRTLNQKRSQLSNDSNEPQIFDSNSENSKLGIPDEVIEQKSKDKQKQEPQSQKQQQQQLQQQKSLSNNLQKSQQQSKECLLLRSPPQLVKNMVNSSNSIDSKHQLQQVPLLQNNENSSNLLEFKEESLGRLEQLESNLNESQGSRKNNNNYLPGFQIDKGGNLIQLPTTAGGSITGSSSIAVGRLTTYQKELLISQQYPTAHSKANSNNHSPTGASIHDLEHFPLQSNSRTKQQSHSLSLLQEELLYKEQIGAQNGIGSQNSSQVCLDQQNQIIQIQKTKTLPGGNFNLLIQQQQPPLTGVSNNSSGGVGTNNIVSNSPGFKFKSLAHLLKTNAAKKKLLDLLNVQKYKRLLQFHLNIINDVSVDSTGISNSSNSSSNSDNNNSNDSKATKLTVEEKRVQKLSKSMLEDFTSTSQVWLPDNFLLIMWDILVMFVQIFLTIISPIERTFQQTGFMDRIVLYAFEIYIAPIVLIMNVFVTMNKGYYDEGMVITSRRKILKRYGKLMIWLDILNIICCFVYKDQQVIFIFIASLYRLAHSMRCWEQIDEYLEISHRFSTLTQMLELLMLIFLIAHLCACGFFFISKADFDMGISPTWIFAQKIHDATWDTQYIYSIYFEFITMTTIGYGDIYPCSINERLYVIFMTFVSCGVFGYSLNAVGQIFRDLSMQLSSFKQTKYDISKYLKNRNITKRVQFKIFKYLEYLNRQESEGHFFLKGEKILNQVSSNLKEEVQREYYGKILNNITFFTRNFSSQFLNDLSLHMKELNLAPGDFLFKVNTLDSTLFFLNKGIVELFLPCSTKNDKPVEKIIQRITPGNLIGQQEFLSDSIRQYTARSICISHFVFIRKHDFLNLIEKYPLDYETFCTLKDDYVFKGQDRFLVCESCKQTGHSVLKCDLIFKQYNKLQVVNRHFYSQNQDRSQFIRQIHYKLRIKRANVSSSLKKFRQNFISKAIRMNIAKLYKSDEFDSDSSEIAQSNINNNFNYNPSEASHNLNQASIRHTAGSYANADSLTFKSYSRPNMTMTTEIGIGSALDEDKVFFKKFPKIYFEDGQYLILSSSARSSSSSDSSESEEYGEEEYEQQFRQIQHDYPRQGMQFPSHFDAIDERRSTYNGDSHQLRHPTLIKRPSERRHPTGLAPSIALSPTSKPISQTSISMENSLQTGYSLEQQNPQLFLRHSQQTYSSTSSIPTSQISVSNQFTHSTSFGFQPSSPSLMPGSSNHLPPPPQLPGSNTLIPSNQPQQNISQMIAGLSSKNYFDTTEFLEETNNNNGQTENKKLTLFLPPVEEASEVSEQSQQDMTTSFSNQIQSSPLIRKSHRESSSKRQQSRKYSSTSIPRSDSMIVSKDELRRKSTRTDSMNTQRLIRDGKKVTYIVDSSQNIPPPRDIFQRGEQGSGLNNSSSKSMTVINSLSKSYSKSQSRNSKQLAVFDRQRSRMSQQISSNNVHNNMYLVDFDLLKEYKFYYPHNNLSQVLKIRSKTLKKKKVVKQKKTNQQLASNGLLSKSNHNPSNSQINHKSIHSLPPNAFSKQLEMNNVL